MKLVCLSFLWEWEPGCWVSRVIAWAAGPEWTVRPGWTRNGLEESRGQQSWPSLLSVNCQPPGVLISPVPEKSLRVNKWARGLAFCSSPCFLSPLKSCIRGRRLDGEPPDTRAWGLFGFCPLLPGSSSGPRSRLSGHLINAYVDLTHSTGDQERRFQQCCEGS